MKKKLILLIATFSIAIVATAPATIQACGEKTPPPPVIMTTNSHGFGS